MEQERDEQVIFFKDLIFAALYQWRKILIAALVLALLFGGFQAVKLHRNGSVDQTVVLEQKTLDEIVRLEAVLEDIEISIENHQTYLAESILMSMDPSQVYLAGADIYVDTGYQVLPDATYQTPDKTTAVLRAYQAYLSDDAVLDAVAEDMSTSSRYLSELVKFEILTSSVNTISITVMYPDAEGAQTILNAFIDNLDAATEHISTSIAEHSISVTAYQTGARTDWTLSKTQTEANDRLTTLNEMLSTTQASLDKLQVSDVLDAPTSPVLLAVVGAVLGVCAVVGIAWVRHIATDKVYSARTLNAQTGIKVLNCIPASPKMNFIDRWLKNLEGRAVSDTQIAIAAATVRNYCINTAHLLIVSDCTPAAWDSLLNLLTQAGIQSAYHGSLLQDPAALDALGSCDAVLLIEQCGHSKNVNVEKAMEIIHDQGKQLIGCVLLDG